MVVHFQHKEWPFIGRKPSKQDPGEVGGANAPLTPQQCRGNAAQAAFPQLCWGVRGSFAPPISPGSWLLGFLPIKGLYLR